MYVYYMYLLIYRSVRCSAFVCVYVCTRMYMRVYALVFSYRTYLMFHCTKYSNRSPQIIPACGTVLNVRLSLKIRLNLFAAFQE